VGSLISNDARYTREIKSWIALTKATFRRKKNIFISKFVLKFRKKLVKFNILGHSFLWCWNLDAWESISEIRGKFWIVMLEKDGDQFDRPFEK
jgi:hypothetical protein